MAFNVKNPLLLPMISPVIVETVTKPASAPAATFGLAYTRSGTTPTTIGLYAAGICTKSAPITERAVGLAVSGYAIVQLEPTFAVPLDAPLVVAGSGRLRTVAAPTDYVVGRVVDGMSDGSGTAGAPHYAVIKLS